MEINTKNALESNITHVAVSDVTPNRCTIVAAGDEDDCREACTDDTMQVMRMAPGTVLGTNLEIGERAHHADGQVW